MQASRPADIEEGEVVTNSPPLKEKTPENQDAIVLLIQKIIAEVIGTYFVVFAGCCAVVLHKQHGQVSFEGLCVVWGLIVMVMVYSVGHISGAHFNPAVTITMAIFRKFPYKMVLVYIAAQMVGSVLASGTLCLLFDVKPADYFGTVPSGSNLQSLILEVIVSFLLMFVISGVATDNRAIGELAGIAIGMTIMLNVFISGNTSGGSMNPARSLGPAAVMRITKGLWIYILGPIAGAILGGFAYNLIRFTDKPLSELTKSKSLLRTLSRGG
ncbi:probable aquaporin NIP-type [Rutidosis leptorrhynchoides]|uniref:probable aquaporin NIP-type n=1 Tax=Rutidosis leptorrhynchoides TaxID=125765 RepID=UPI003A98F113